MEKKTMELLKPKAFNGIPNKAREIPLAMSAKDIQALGFSRPLAYRFLNMADLPVIEIGGRKFMHRDLFFDWLAEQATGKKAEGEA